jgi:outer membrane murein-binding lipoprotein Lpp
MSGNQSVKCPHCKKTVDLSETQSNPRLLLLAIICIIFAGAIGFGLGAVLNRTSKQKIEEANTKIERLGNEIEQLRTQKQQEEIARQNADLEKRKEQERGNVRVDWRKLGFDNFVRQIPNKGEVKRLDEPVLGSYGVLVGPLTRVMQVIGDDEVIVTAPFLDITRGSRMNQDETNYVLNKILEKGFTCVVTLSELEKEKIDLNPSLVDKQIFLKGFSTRGMVDKELWWSKGQARGNPEIAIINTYTYMTTNGGTNTVPLAIPLDFIREGLTEIEFERLLKHNIKP